MAEHATCRRGLLMAGLILLVGVAADGYEYDPSDFAATVISYSPGQGVPIDWLTEQPFDDPQAALGRPTIDTTEDDPFGGGTDVWPVLPVFPAWRRFEVVTVGYGGSLVLAFDHKVLDDIINPYGVDLILFGNAKLLIDGAENWENGDPDTVTVDGTCPGEPGVVSVSQDGQNWLRLSAGPWADSFAPTLGRIYAPDPATGSWWGDPTDPTEPLAPSWAAADFAGWTVAQVARAYGTSAGGTGIDIGLLDLPVDPETGYKWIQYVRIETPQAADGTAEIDAISDVAEMPCHPGDANGDGRVSLGDLSILAGHWHGSGKVWSNGDFTADGVVSIGDLSILAGQWGWGVSSPPAPEPMALALLLAGASVVLKTHRPRRSGPL